ncbi:MAG: TIGR02147 family protein [Bdellovibrionales bacterium]|nr:TIGR02147 family protein [Bdellovibrionales bacterium]
MKDPWREYLNKEFSERRSKNPKYSLRSFAKSLGLSPAHTSLLLSGQRTVKAKSALQLAESLGVTPSEAVAWSTTKFSKPHVDFLEDEISTKNFNPIAEWYYFAILGLANFKHNVAHPRWISQRLNLDYKTSKLAFQRLVELSFLRIEGGQFRQNPNAILTTQDVPSESIRRYHKQHLDLATHKIDSVTVEKREFSTSTIAIDPRRIKAAKAMIRKFRENFLKEMRVGKKSQVYTLGIQLYPLSKEED